VIYGLPPSTVVFQTVALPECQALKTTRLESTTIWIRFYRGEG
jgi:hypothetical protein